MNKNNKDAFNITSLPQEKKPNYALRRVGVGLGLVGLAALGVEGIHATENIGRSAYDVNHCHPGNDEITIAPGQTVWNEAASPLATKLHMPVDEAMMIIEHANPNITQPGLIQPGTTIHIPDCKP